jgi:hypothetical protein
VCTVGGGGGIIRKTAGGPGYPSVCHYFSMVCAIPDQKKGGGVELENGCKCCNY